MALSSLRLNCDDITGPGRVGEMLIRPLSSSNDTSKWTSTHAGRIPLSYRDPLHASTDPAYDPEYTMLDGTTYPKVTQGAQYEFTVVRVNNTMDGTTFTAAIPASASVDFDDLVPLIPVPPAPAVTYTQGQIDGFLAAKEPKPTLAGQNVIVYGDSYTDDDMAPLLGPITTAQMYFRQFCTELGGGTATTYGLVGMRINHVLGSMLASGTWPGLYAPKAGAVWPGVSARPGIGVIDTMTNDIGHYPTPSSGVPAAITGAGGTRYINGIAGLWEAALAVRSSESRLEFHDGATGVTASGGTWPAGNVAFTYLSGGQEAFSVTPGDWRQIAIPAAKIPQSGPLAGRVYVGIQQHDPSVVTPAALAVSVDSGTAWTWTPPGWEAYGAATESYAVIPVDLPVDGAGHTLRLTHAGSAGQMMAVDTVLIPSITPPDIYCMQAFDIIKSPIFSDADVAVWKANKALLEPSIRAAIAKFPNAAWVPTTVTSAGIYAPDGIHPNLTGMTRRAADLAAAFYARWFRADGSTQADVASIAAEASARAAADLVETNRATAAEALLAPKASPVFTGNPTAPTPAAGDNDTSVPTTAFVQSEIALRTLQRTVYTTPSSATAIAIPTTAKTLKLRLRAAGGGGGSGRKGLAATLRSGGAGGGAGGYDEFLIDCAALRTATVNTVYLWVGTGGTGGAAVSANSTSGNAGLGGTATFVSTSSSGTLATARAASIAYVDPGDGGALGGTATATGGLAGQSSKFTSGAGGNSTNTGSPQTALGGGAGGGSITTGNTALAGGSTTPSSNTSSGTKVIYGFELAGGANTGGAGVAASTIAAVPYGPVMLPGGSGGGSNLTGAGGTGGAGALGTGGGGGGASVDATGNSGAGGAGGNGFAVVEFVF